MSKAVAAAVDSLLTHTSGNLVFHGPKEEVVPFFQSMGFYVPERKAVSDFLQEVTSPKDQAVRLFRKRKKSLRFSAIIAGAS